MDESRLRAGDADRDATISLLREAFAEGRLTQAEFDERLDEAHGARTFAELGKLTADLPKATQNPAVVEGEAAKKRKGLRSAWASWLGVGVLVNIIWFATAINEGPAPNYWPIWVIGPWGGVLLIATLTSKTKRSEDG